MTLLHEVADTVERIRAITPAGAAFRRVAIIDIGSNSVRLVVYDGPRRMPFILFNEKVMAGLGSEIGETGRLGADAMARSLRALTRFARLCEDMEVDTVRCVATAAVRDAANGGAFVADVRAIGLPVEVLSGEDEGRASAHGLLSGMPGADGVMGDLGGGSLELVRVTDGRIEQAVSVPLGVLRVREIAALGKDALPKAIATMLTEAGWRAVPEGLPFYMVGGSWRALARIDMHETQYPLPVFHHYEMAPARLPALQRLIATTDRSTLKLMPALSSSRVPTLPHAAALLRHLVDRLRSRCLVVSATGLREGLLFQDLPTDIAALDPLIEAARAEGDAQGRFAGHGDLIEQWIAPLFTGDSAGERRIRHAACLLADVGWRANPDFRAERGVDIALHGNWVGITGCERAMLGQALHSALGGGMEPPAVLGRLASPDALSRARRWGLAIRLIQRLSGGVGHAIAGASVSVEDGAVLLRIAPAARALFGETTERRLRQLAQAMGLPHKVV